nr:cell wall-binding repeat-containing protein [Diaminobutyricibacter tongyongensis]
MSGNCWQASTHTLWVSYGDGTQTTLFSVSDTGSVVPRLSDAIASGFGGCLDGPDGSLWSGYFTIRISPDDTKIETRYGTYGTTPIVTPDGLWYVAVGPVSTHGGLGYTPTEPVDVGQTYGADRYATAAAIATQSYPTTAPVVFIASGDNFPDALSAAPAAAKAGGPLLLTAANGLPASTATELKALSPSKVVLVGGTGALSAAVETRIKQIVPRASVVRTSGADRYATARAVVSSTFASAGTVWVAAGATFPDSLSAAAAAGSTGSPVVLVDGAATTIDAKTLDLIAALHPTSINVAGATGAVSAGIETQLRSIAPVTRYGGADRYATNVAIAQSVPHSVKAFVASGLLFPDALSGATWAASTHAPLYLSQRTCLPNPVLNSLVQGAPTSVTLLGGPGALNYNVAALGQC